MYNNLKKIYHMNYDHYEESYRSRYNSDYSVHTNFDINGNEVFYVITPEIQNMLIDISKIDRDNWLISRKLPGVAIRQLSKKFLIDEITITNDIEGINSSRKEIDNIIDNTNKKIKDVRFYDLVKKYQLLSEKRNIKIETCQDLRKIYDELVLQDVILKNKNNKPDGILFRSNEVNVWNNGHIIHKGLMPEENIINHIESALNHLNDSKINSLLRASAFHYLLGYIHPFYDGNGRLNRFISSYVISGELYPLISYMLSYTIKSTIKEYYENFKLCNDVLCKAEITPFIHYFISTIYSSETNLLKLFKEKYASYLMYEEKLNKLKITKNNNKMYSLIHLLMQAELFSENGISLNELINETKTTEQTLRKRLNIVKAAKLLKEATVNKRKYYKLDLIKVNKQV